MKYLNVIPECYVDTNLISTLLHADVNHQKGCCNVARTLSINNKDRFAIGIIDKDKRTPGYLDQFSKIADRGHLELYVHASKPHYFITISPAVDKMILDCADELGVNMGDFGLPTSLSEFTKKTKKVDSNKNPVFTTLFQNLLDSEDFVVLSRTLNYLLTNTYNSKIDDLKNLFLA